MLCAALIILAGHSIEAQASPGKQKVIKLERKISKLQSRLQRLFNKLPVVTRAQVVAARSGKSDDADSDGVPDNLEGNSGRCDSDSDDDGVDDGEEYENGSDPDDDDSDDDGHSDGDEVERTGVIESISDTAVVIGSVSFIFDVETTFQGDDDQPLTRTDFSVGDCAEAEGHKADNDTVIADSVKMDDDC
jgi:hypothetical protein